MPTPRATTSLPKKRPSYQERRAGLVEDNLHKIHQNLINRPYSLFTLSLVDHPRNAFLTTNFAVGRCEKIRPQRL